MLIIHIVLHIKSNLLFSCRAIVFVYQVSYLIFLEILVSVMSCSEVLGLRI
jgi:hypothetical protein